MCIAILVETVKEGTDGGDILQVLVESDRRFNLKLKN